MIKRHAGLEVTNQERLAMAKGGSLLVKHIGAISNFYHLETR